MTMVIEPWNYIAFLAAGKQHNSDWGPVSESRLQQEMLDCTVPNAKIISAGSFFTDSVTRMRIHMPTEYERLTGFVLITQSTAALCFRYEGGTL